MVLQELSEKKWIKAQTFQSDSHLTDRLRCSSCFVQAEKGTKDLKWELILKEGAWASDWHNTKFEHQNNVSCGTVCTRQKLILTVETLTQWSYFKQVAGNDI